MKLGGQIYDYKYKGKLISKVSEEEFKCDRCEKKFKHRILYNSLPTLTKKQRLKKEEVAKTLIPSDGVVEIDTDYDICGDCLDTMVKQHTVKKGLL